MHTGRNGECYHQYIKADNGCQYHAVVMNEFRFHKKAFNYTNAISVPFRWPYQQMTIPLMFSSYCNWQLIPAVNFVNSSLTACKCGVNAL